MEEAVSDLREKRRMWQLKGVGDHEIFILLSDGLGYCFPCLNNLEAAFTTVSESKQSCVIYGRS